MVRDTLDILEILRSSKEALNFERADILKTEH